MTEQLTTKRKRAGYYRAFNALGKYIGYVSNGASLYGNWTVYNAEGKRVTVATTKTEAVEILAKSLV